MQCQSLQGRIDLFNRVLGITIQLFAEVLAIEVRIFGEGSKMSLIDICNCLGIKDLRGVLDNNYRKKRPGPQRYLQPRQGKGKLPSGVKRISSNLFILVNNNVINC